MEHENAEHDKIINQIKEAKAARLVVQKVYIDGDTVQMRALFDLASLMIFEGFSVELTKSGLTASREHYPIDDENGGAL